MKEIAIRYNEFYNRTSKGVKILFTLLYDVPNNLRRFFVSEQKGNVGGMVAAVGVMVLAGWLTAIIDMVTLLTDGRIYWFDSYETDEVHSQNISERKGERSDELGYGAAMEAGSDFLPYDGRGWIKTEGESKLGGDTYENTPYQQGAGSDDKGKYEK